LVSRIKESCERRLKKAITFVQVGKVNRLCSRSSAHGLRPCEMERFPVLMDSVNGCC